MSFIEKLDEKSLLVFNEVTKKKSSEQCMFFLNAFWDEFSDQAEFMFAISNQIFRLADMKAKGIMFVHLYEEGHDLDFDMGIYMFEQLCKFWEDPNHEWFRGSQGLANWGKAHPNFKEMFKKSQPQMMTAIARKKELRERVDVNFDGRVSMLEYLLYQYGASPKSLIERSMAAPDMPEELRNALNALADVQKRVNEYEAEKHRLEEESKGLGVKALGAKNMLAQLTSSPLWENINRALITAEAKVRIAQRKYGKGGSALPADAGGNPMRNEGALWWMARELQEKQERYGAKGKGN